MLAPEPAIILTPPPGTPKLLTRITASEALGAAGYTIQPSSLIKWPLPVWRIGRFAHYRREDVFAEANRKIASTMRPQAPAAR
ncbi:MAG: hypothetical protein ACI9ZH_001814 [Paracoccaceae bacterium]|jgi:hypothetical protein